MATIWTPKIGIEGFCPTNDFVPGRCHGMVQRMKAPDESPCMQLVSTGDLSFRDVHLVLRRRLFSFAAGGWWLVKVGEEGTRAGAVLI